jgi:hypothetical protein
VLLLDHAINVNIGWAPAFLYSALESSRLGKCVVGLDLEASRWICWRPAGSEVRAGISRRLPRPSLPGLFENLGRGQVQRELHRFAVQHQNDRYRAEHQVRPA